MNKKTKYRKLHSLLYKREDVRDNVASIDDFYDKALKLATEFLSNDFTVLDKFISDELVGIVNMGKNLPYTTTRSILMGLMNDVDREE